MSARVNHTQAVKQKKSQITQERLIKSAINLFSTQDFKDVSIADVGTASELSTPAVYRYFAGKQDIYLAALRRDLDELHAAVIDTLEREPFATLIGSAWYEYARRVADHPLARRAILNREHGVLEFLNSLESTNKFKAALLKDLVLAQEHGLIRSDLNLVKAMESMQQKITQSMIPLMFEGKFLSPEWNSAIYSLLALSFHPVPDISTPEKFEAFRVQMEQLVATVKLERGL